MNVIPFSTSLQQFAKHNSREASPLYHHLCLRTAEDTRLLEAFPGSASGQPIVNLFLASVHYLLLSGVRHDLGNYYATCVAEPMPPNTSFPAFRDFCLTQQVAIRELMAKRQVQTNEVGRCAYLFPAFCRVAHIVRSRPLALIDIGTSAGLNLIWDRYAYDFGIGGLQGNQASRVRITTNWKSDRIPTFPTVMPVVAQRHGVDLRPLDVRKTEDVLWLRSLIWPNQLARLALLDLAIEEFLSAPSSLLAGDGLALTKSLIAEAPIETAICVFHCHTLNQFSPAQRQEFHEILVESSKDRLVVQLSAEWLLTPSTELRLNFFEGGQCRSEHLANVDQHGHWIEWLV